MKAWEAIHILESVDPDTEVILTLGRVRSDPIGSIPKWAQMPQPVWVEKQNEWTTRPPYVVTCKTVQ